MVRYIIKRLFWMIPIVLGVAILVFTLMYFSPSDAAQIMLGSNGTPEQIEELRESLGLNKPYIERLFTYLTDIFVHGNLGTSYFSKVQVSVEMAQRMPRTVLLSLICMLISVFVGVPLGIMAALNQDKVGDRISMILALIGVSMPNFWLALMLILFFAVQLRWLPAMGTGGLEYYILPAISCSTINLARQARQSRSSMLEVIRADYITTARSKGIPYSRVILKHALPNALIPVITVAGTSFGAMLGGALVIEQIFALPGVGSYILTAVNQRDYPVVQGGVIVLAIAFSIVMLLVDLVYAFVDPRIKAQYAGKGSGRKKHGK